MRYQLDELLEEEDLRSLTEEAMERPARRRAPWRRLGAVAACAALVLCLANYQALAAGVERVVRYFAGVGAVDQGAEAMVLAEPLTWTDGDSLYLLEDVMQRGGWLYVHMEIVSAQTESECGVEIELCPAEGDEGEWLSEEKAVDAGRYAVEYLKDWRAELGGQWLDAGYETHMDVTPVFQVGDLAREKYVLKIRIDGKEEIVKELDLIPIAEQAVVMDSRTFPEGTVTVLVSEDGRGVTNIVDWAPEWEASYPYIPHDLYLSFVGASGQRYRPEFYNSYREGFERVEYTLPEDVTEEIVAVEIDAVAFDPPPASVESVRHEELDWIIELP